MKVAIFTGGKHAEKKLIKKFLAKFQMDYIIAADSGLDTLAALKCKPDYIVGDFDSLEKKSLLKKYRNVKTCVYPEDKDYTDSELAMQKAYAVLDGKRKKEIFVFGAGGAERLDHLLYFLRVFRKKLPPICWLYDTGIAFCLFEKGKNSLDLRLQRKHSISVFNVNSSKNGDSKKAKIKTEGLHWKLDDLDWSENASISNRNDKKKLSFTVISGRFLILLNTYAFDARLYSSH